MINSRTASTNLEDMDQLLDHPQHTSIGKILLEEHIGDPSFTLEELKKELVTLIIAESLRLYPVALIFARNSNKDIQFGKYTIYRGTPIVFFPYALHRNPELYPNPDIFNPDRFSENNSTAKPWTHIPFAEGVRSCMGKNYAMLMMKIFLAHVIRDFRLLSLTQKEDFELTWSLLLRSSKPLSMTFIPR